MHRRIFGWFGGAAIVAALMVPPAVVLAHHCVENNEINTCNQLGSPPAGYCVYSVLSTNMCIHGSPSPNGPYVLGGTSTMECRWNRGIYDEATGSCSGPGTIVTSMVQCQAGQGECSHNGGGGD
jgi:hypothetical protein